MKLETTSCTAPAVELPNVINFSYNALASLAQWVVFSTRLVPKSMAFCTGTLNLLSTPDGAHSIAPLPHSFAFCLTQVVKLPPHCPGMNGILQAWAVTITSPAILISFCWHLRGARSRISPSTQSMHVCFMLYTPVSGSICKASSSNGNGTFSATSPVGTSASMIFSITGLITQIIKSTGFFALSAQSQMKVMIGLRYLL
mmetsp:Transcript_87898/g.160906  ORF Transcript_87898/g.160906 Transcript_87898/m.160906 type:complete len:200 (+) Transcript_87898:1961-2560(+)